MASLHKLAVCSATARLCTTWLKEFSSTAALSLPVLMCINSVGPLATDRWSRRPLRHAAATSSCHTSTRKSSTTRAEQLLACVSGQSTSSSTTMWCQRWSPSDRSLQLPMQSCMKPTPPWRLCSKRCGCISCFRTSLKSGLEVCWQCSSSNLLCGAQCMCRQ